MNAYVSGELETRGTKVVPNRHATRPLKGKTLCIISGSRFRSELLAFFLEQKAGTQCKCIRNPGDHPTAGNKKSAPPDMIVLDCTGMEREEVSTLLSEDRAHFFSQSTVCLLGVIRDQGIEVEGLKQGFRGFFYEQDPMDHILAGLNAILRGQLWITPEVLTQSMLNGDQKSSGEQQDSDAVLLTPREIEIIRAIAIGTSNSEIARKLFISPHTVKTHVYNAFKKINVTNRFQAAMWASENL